MNKSALEVLNYVPPSPRRVPRQAWAGCKLLGERTVRKRSPSAGHGEELVDLAWTILWE